MEIRTSDGSQDPELMMAIGWVMRGSAELSTMFQQLASTVTGSKLVPFLFDDKTLGSQRDMLERLVLATNWNPHAPHPAISDADRTTLLDILMECRQLIDFRNRVAHDEWSVWPTDLLPDAIEGRRPARWAKSEVHSSIRALHVLRRHLTLAAAALSTMEVKIIEERVGPGRRVAGAGTPATFLRSCAQRKAGRIDDWTWDEKQSKHRPRRDNERINLIE